MANGDTLPEDIGLALQSIPVEAAPCCFLVERGRAHDKVKIKATGAIANLVCPVSFRKTIAAARSKSWVVCANPPFRSPEQFFAYLSCYTHRVAIGDSRTLALDSKQVRIRCRKPKQPEQVKLCYGTITLGTEAFIDRFLLHVLPVGMQRIHHFGILAHNFRTRTLKLTYKALGTADVPAPDQIPNDDDSDEDVDIAPAACPHCGGILRKFAPIPKTQRQASAYRNQPSPPPTVRARS